jgi:hypothetical protein
MPRGQGQCGVIRADPGWWVTPGLGYQQEVDHYWDWLEPKMSSVGYVSAYHRKPTNADGACLPLWHTVRPGGGVSTECA